MLASPLEEEEERSINEGDQPDGLEKPVAKDSDKKAFFQNPLNSLPTTKEIREV